MPDGQLSSRVYMWAVLFHRSDVELQSWSLTKSPECILPTQFTSLYLFSPKKLKGKLYTFNTKPPQDCNVRVKQLI